jgi:hypothetical protein
MFVKFYFLLLQNGGCGVQVFELAPQAEKVSPASVSLYGDIMLF